MPKRAAVGKKEVKAGGTCVVARKPPLVPFVFAKWASAMGGVGVNAQGTLRI